MIFSYNWLQSFFKGAQLPKREAQLSKTKLPQPQKLAEILTGHIFEVAEVKKAGDDWALNIDVLPNRGPDCFSHLGIAREISAILNLKLTAPQLKVREDKKQKTENAISVEVQDKKACLRYLVRVVLGVKVGPSPVWLQERLKVCGLRPINNIVDATNYVMLETGQPLHVFDLEKISSREIIVRHAKKGEKITTLDNQKYDLSENILVIADQAQLGQKPAQLVDNEEPLALAGIKGGKKAEITENTKDIVIESANFAPILTRRASRYLNLRTDASVRFEVGLDPNLAEQAVDQCAQLIQQLSNGRIAQGRIDLYPQKQKPRKIILDLSYAKALLGIAVPVKRAKVILERLGLKVISRNAQKLSIQIPTRRLDLSIPEDFIEEIGRIYRYDKIPAIFPTGAILPSIPNEEMVYENKIKDILVAGGLNEVYNYSFFDGALMAQNLIELANPVSQEQRYLRPGLTPNLLKNIRENLKYFDEAGLFEIGKVYFQTNKTAEEQKMIAAALSRKSAPAKNSSLFYEVKGLMDLLLNKLGISDFWYDDQLKEQEAKCQTAEILHNLRRAQIKIGDELLGWLGEIKKEILEKSGIQANVAVFEIDFAKLVKLSQEERIYQPPSKYPAIVRDLAILTDQTSKVEDVLNVIEITGGVLVADVDLFDIYEGEEIPENKKNLAFHIIYQSDERTLTNEEVNKLQEKIIKALEEEGWEVRK